MKQNRLGPKPRLWLKILLLGLVLAASVFNVYRTNRPRQPVSLLELSTLSLLSEYDDY
ncbi:hypothetical protein GCM10028803_14970 [Larkinella knui]|uniref:hypothetical protein n=1 Tax=Larkinella knui TaxID=2025310 RepID=UPI00163B0B1B|nr:hypothetical protein [Larkinella knui]